MIFKFATSNPGKKNEIRKIIPDCEFENLDLPEIQDTDVLKVAVEKAKHAYNLLTYPVWIEDTGLKINALNNLPGALIKWFLKELSVIGLTDLVSKLKTNNAEVIHVYAYYDGLNAKYFYESIKGKISNAPLGSNGFGWDSIFIPKGSTKTYGQMTIEEKNKYSTRAIILNKIKNNIYPLIYKL